jgi:glycosyltransferase involved in cell wall biosynthesis
VISLAIDTLRLDAASRIASTWADDPYVLVLSRLHPVKGLELLMDAFAAASVCPIPGASKFRLVIAGDGEPGYVRALRERAAASDVASRISFEGWVDGDRKGRLLAGAALFALPSHHENFGLSLAEALSCGVPVVVSRQVQLADAVVDAQCGWVSELTLDALAAALREAMSSPKLLQARSAAAKKLGQTFSPAMVARQLVELYDRLALHAAAIRSPITAESCP